MKLFDLEKADLEKVLFRLEEKGVVLWCQLNAPPGNILDSVMITDLRRLIAAARKLPDLRLLVIQGSGNHFSYGASIPEHRPDRIRNLLEGFHGIFRDLMEVDFPVLSLVHGKCLGGGLELAAFCDRVVVEQGAELGQPEIRLGVFAPLGSLLLPWRCGAAGANLALTGKTVDASTAREMGLADELVQAGEGEAAVRRWVREELLPLSASSLKRARKASRWALHRELREGLVEMEFLYLEDLMKTKDAKEGINAFLEKRSPVWSHE